MSIRVSAISPGFVTLTIKTELGTVEQDYSIHKARCLIRELTRGVNQCTILSDKSSTSSSG